MWKSMQPSDHTSSDLEAARVWKGRASRSRGKSSSLTANVLTAKFLPSAFLAATFFCRSGSVLAQYSVWAASSVLLSGTNIWGEGDG